jgi:hypothetical protein
MNAKVVYGACALATLVSMTARAEEVREDRRRVSSFEWMLGGPVSGTVGLLAVGLSVNVFATNGLCVQLEDTRCIAHVDHDAFMWASHVVVGALGVALVVHAVWALFEWEIARSRIEPSTFRRSNDRPPMVEGGTGTDQDIVYRSGG